LDEVRKAQETKKTGRRLFIEIKDKTKIVAKAKQRKKNNTERGFA